MTVIKPNWPAPSHIRAYTTTRQSWGSLDISTNDPGERERLKTLLTIPNEPVWLKQTHSTLAVPATPENQGKEADASFASQANQVCLVLTADCLPLLVCDREGRHIAAIHAGWRGLANGVIENTLTSMQQDPANLLVWLGPAIGPQRFEVGADVYHAFTDQFSGDSAAFTPGTTNKWYANLYQLAQRRLRSCGVQAIYGGEYCTHSQADLFYSWRRDQNKMARMASLIWIESIR